MKPGILTAEAPSGGTISVRGFVKAAGTYHYMAGVTAEDALDEAGGYERCDSGQAFWEERRGAGHTPYDLPPKVKRAGRRLKLPEHRTEWTRFILKPGDEIEFRHFAF